MTFDPRSLPLIAGCLVGTALSAWIFAESSELVASNVPHCAPMIAAPDIEARAAYAYDAVSGRVLFEKNASAQLPLASLTKVMTVATALQTLQPHALITIKKEALAPEGVSGLVAGEEWYVEDLANLTLIGSLNDGARALLLAAVEAQGMDESMFIESMNRYARSLGLNETYFINETGLDLSSSTAGAYGSARDMARLIAFFSLNEPELVERSALPALTAYTLAGTGHTIENTSLLATAFLGSVASKTGYTDLAGGNMVFVFEPVPGRPVSVAVLGSSRDGRVEDARAVAEYAASSLKVALLCKDIYD